MHTTLRRVRPGPGPFFTLILAVAALCAGCAHAADDPSVEDSGPPGDAAKPDGGGKDGSNTKDVAPDAPPGCKTAPPSNVCGLDPQCGCGADTCDIDYAALNGETKCVTAGSGGAGTACDKTVGECAAGLTCVWGVCRPFCSTDGADCGKPGTNKCVQLTDSQSKPILNLLICRLNCSLDDTGQSCGGSGRGCVFIANDVTDCRDESQYGTTTCTQNAPFCGAGYVCLTNNQCAKWCDINAPNCGPKTCNPLQTPPVVNGKTYGVCI